MIIKTVKLKNSGFSGAEIHYVIEEIKGTRKSNTLIKKFPKDPIHKDLENLFKDLRENLLDICEIVTPSMDQQDRMFIIHDAEVTGIEFDSEGFILHGEKSVFGNKKIKLNTPKVEEIDNYEHFEAVMDVIKLIVTETKLYMDGEKKVSDEELVERWVSSGKDKTMNMDTFNNLSDEEKRDFCTNFLEKEYGAMVLHRDDVLSEDEASKVVEATTEFVVGDSEETIIPVTDKKPKKDKKIEAHSPEESF
jgi:hypothetical protein